MPSEGGIRHGFMRAAMNAPFLEREEEHLLAVRWKSDRDEAAQHPFVRAAMRKAISRAVRAQRQSG